MIGLFMGPLATVFEALTGRLFKAVTVPLMAVGLLVLTHQLWKARDARLVAQGERICDARWEAQIRGDARAQAERDLWAGRKILEVERETDEGLTNDLQALNESIDLLRTPSGADGNCLSPGVLDVLKRGEAARRAAVPKQGS